MKVLLDTNVLASAFATRGLCADVLRLVLNQHSLVISQPILRELEKTLAEKFRAPREKIEAALALLRRRELAATPTDYPRIDVRDPDDLHVLASALASNVDALVTGDKDLLDLSGKLDLVILSPRAFWEMLNAKRRQ